MPTLRRNKGKKEIDNPRNEDSTLCKLTESAFSELSLMKIEFISFCPEKEKDGVIFLQKLQDFLFRNYCFEWDQRSNEVFTYFYNYFRNDLNVGIMCLSYMIFGTSGFTKMHSQNDGLYECRGFLQIALAKNYDLASDLFYNYLKTPILLGIFSLNTMKSSLKVFKIMTIGKTKTFYDLVKSLKVSDGKKYYINNHKQDMLYKNMNDLYKILCKLFEVKCCEGKGFITNK
ncbi:hypothetical protein DMUE_4925 [Dictyocoela muelleri]|nr:hypothetical protein DMUE_4925 [Dictyocoela muelleri]